MKSQHLWGFSKNPVKFRIPTSENLVPIRLDIEIDGQRFRDAFTWNPAVFFIDDDIDPDSEVVVFAKRTVKDLKLPPAFVTQIVQSIQVSDLNRPQLLILLCIPWPFVKQSIC
ncbi:hypothetical protein RJ639_017788 [Escallonia herrerae]|uniref:Uncharacterized protein n=1 Tax=Escallonia herrerae TaxID=1293975 RepID=A0AA88VDQ8_9ASTE|nr:hypothetical protein RJ639_017788 [Escallonia herrerae]